MAATTLKLIYQTAKVRPKTDIPAKSLWVAGEQAGYLGCLQPGSVASIQIRFHIDLGLSKWQLPHLKSDLMNRFRFAGRPASFIRTPN